MPREAELLAILEAGPLPHAFMTRMQRRAMQAGIDALIDYLDAVEPDPDLEDDGTEDEAELEPSLGAPEVEFTARGLPEHRGHFDQRRWNDGSTHSEGDLIDLEEDASDDEPMLGAPEHHPSRYWGHGWHKSQLDWAAGGDCGEREQEDEHGGDINDEPQDDHDGREPDEDFEPTLGQPEGVYHNQTLWGRIGGTAHEDEEDFRRHPGYREGMRLMGVA